MPFWEPKNSLPLSSRGEDSARLGRLRVQRKWPSSVFRATTLPACDPAERERMVAYTVSPATAGVEADRAPRRRLQRVCPVYLSIALSVASSPSWKILLPDMTGGNSSRALPPRAHTVLNGGRIVGEAGKKRV